MYDDNMAEMDANYEDESVEYIDEPEVEIVGNGSSSKTQMTDLMDEPDPNAYSPHDSVNTGVPKGASVVNDLIDFSQSVGTGEAEQILQGLEKFSKSQLVRFMDITIIGPLLLYYAYKGRLSVGERTIIGLIGLGTVVYNGRNFFAKRKVMGGYALSEIKELYQDKVGY